MTSTKDQPREVTIKIPRLSSLPWPENKRTWFVGIACFFLAYSFVSGMQKEIRDLKKQQNTAEERIKKEVLMPGGSATSSSAEFKLDPKRDTAKDPVTDQAGNPLPQEEVQSTQPSTPTPAAPVPATAPAPAPRYSPPPVSGPGNYDAPVNYYRNSGPSGPGNM